MKKCGALLLTILLLCTVLPIGAVSQEETPVSAGLTPVEQLLDSNGYVLFADAAVEAAIHAALGVTEGPLTTAQLGKLGAKNEELQISVSSPATLDLSVLQLCGKLKYLSLDQVTPADTGAISALTNLQSLFIRNAKVSDFSFLSGCQKITDLWIGGCPCKDISFISELPNLINFHIDSKVTDLSPLYTSKKLVSVSIGEASDAEVNAMLDQIGKQIRFLGLKSCPITDATLERIAGLKLTGLLIGDVTLSSVALLWRIASLELLKFFRLRVDSLEGIQDLKKLRELELEDMEGTIDLTPAYTLPKLTKLSLNGVTVSTLTGIEGLKALVDLTIIRVKGITDYTPLSGLKKLKALHTDVPELMPEGMPVQ